MGSDPISDADGKATVNAKDRSKTVPPSRCNSGHPFTSFEGMVMGGVERPVHFFRRNRREMNKNPAHWLPEWKGKLHIGCLNCSMASKTLDPKRRIAVGFGLAALLRDGKTVWMEYPKTRYEDALTVASATKRVKKAPNSDWRIILDGPMHGETFQWQGNKWVLIESNEGFA